MEPITMALLAGSIGEGILNLFMGRKGQDKNIEWEKEKFYAALEDAQAARELNQRNYYDSYLPEWNRRFDQYRADRAPQMQSSAMLGPGIDRMLGGA